MKYTQLLVLVGFAFMVSTAMAASSKRMNHTIDAADFETLQLEMAIGEMDVEIYDGDTIELDIHIEADRNWFSFRRPDVDDIELEQRAMGSRLYLGIDDDNLEQTWRVRIPVSLTLEIEVGVGDVGVVGLDNNLTLELGVGAASVEVASENYREIEASSGVGEAVIRGFNRGADNERRALVGADAYYSGDGQYRIEMEVGVGEVSVRH